AGRAPVRDRGHHRVRGGLRHSGGSALTGPPVLPRADGRPAPRAPVGRVVRWGSYGRYGGRSHSGPPSSSSSSSSGLVVTAPGYGVRAVCVSHEGAGPAVAYGHVPFTASTVLGVVSTFGGRIITTMESP